MEALMSRAIEADMGLLFGLSLLVMCALLTWLFRHVLGVVGPLAVVLLSIVWTVGAMGHAGVPFTGVTSVLTSLLIVVGVGDAIHIQSSYRDALSAGNSRDQAIVQAVAQSGVPVLLTSLTTAAGLLSFRTASLVSVQQMGTFGALGVLAALVSTLVLLPCVLSLYRRGTFGRSRTVAIGVAAAPRDWIDRALAVCDRCSRTPRARRATIALALVVAIAAFAGVSRIQARFDPVASFPSDHPVRAALDSIDEHVGGMGGVVLSIEAAEGESLRRAELLRRLAELQRFIEGYRADGAPLVTNVTSVLDRLRETHAALLGDGAAPFAEDGVVTDLFTLLELAGPDTLSRLWTLDDQRALMVVRVHWQEAGAYLPFAAHIEQGVERIIGDAARVRVTGSVFTAAEVVEALVADLLRSFSSALLVISLLMLAMLRDLRLALVALVPNLLPLAVTAGLMGWVGIDLNLNTLLVASIALGIAVDDTIHLLYQYASRRRAGLEPEPALHGALQHSGRAMIATSVVLGAGFCVFTAAVMVNVGEFGLLVAASILFALVLDLLFTPALLRSADVGVRPWHERTPPRPPTLDAKTSTPSP